MSSLARASRRFAVARPAQGWLPLILLVALVMSVVYSIDRARWAENTVIMYPIAALGMVLGMWMSNRRANSTVIVVAGVLIGALLSFFVVSEALPGPSDLLGNFVDLFRRTLDWVQARRAGEIAGQQPLVGAIRTSWGFVSDLWIRLIDWFEVLSTFKASADNVVFLLWMAYAAWGMGFLGAWGLFRRRSVAIAVIGSAVALGVNITYVGPTRIPFVIFMVALLLLMVQVNLFTLSDRWERTNTDYSAELGINVTALSLVLVAVVTLFAVFFPRIRGNALSEAFWTYLGDGWSNVEAATNRLFSGVSNPSGSTTLSGPQQLGVGTILPFTQRATLIVQSTHEAYWRGATFDRFLGDRWENSDKALTEREPGQALTKEVDFRARIPVKANFEILDSASSVLFVPGDIVSMDRKYLVQSAQEDDVSDFSAIRATRTVGRRIEYTVDATIPGASVQQLREAGTSYPAWIDKYIQMPDTTRRVSELASRFAQPGDSAFDRAQKIEFFLRRYPFSLDIPELPSGADAVDFYLFELRRGYADYTASAMAVLLRLNGIPARMATGYVSGTFDQETGRFIAGPEDSHTWVEVYFPAYGWVPFEPSGYRVPLGRSEGGAQALGEGFDPIDIRDLEDLLERMDLGSSANSPLQDSLGNPIIDFLRKASGAAIVAGGLVGMVVLGFLLYFLFGIATTRFQSPQKRVRNTYRSMLRYWRWAGYNPGEAQTPLEVGRRIAVDLFDSPMAVNGGDRTDGVAGGFRFAEEPEPPVAIAISYARSVYSEHAVLPADRRAVERAWKTLRPRLMRRILRRRKNDAQ